MNTTETVLALSAATGLTGAGVAGYTARRILQQGGSIAAQWSLKITPAKAVEPAAAVAAEPFAEKRSPYANDVHKRLAHDPATGRFLAAAPAAPRRVA